MKKLKMFCLGVFGMLAFTQCGVSNNPEAVSLAFVKAISISDFKTAKNLCTEETATLLNILEEQLGKTPLPADKLAALKKESALLKSSTCNTTGEKSVCTICCKENGDISQKDVDVKKVDGKWLVYIDKGSRKLPNK